MNCPNCNTLLDKDAVVCFACGQGITEAMVLNNQGQDDREFDEVIQNLIMTDENEQVEDEVQLRQEQRKQKNMERQNRIRSYSYVSYATLAVMFLFTVSLFLTWFTVRGTVAYMGYFYTTQTAKYLDEEAKTFSKEQLTENLNKVASFSPQQFLTYAKEYVRNSGEHNLLAKLQVYYAEGLYVIYFLLLLCAGILVFDRKARFVEVIRISSILSVIFILLNTLAMKLPYINLIVLNAKNVLGESGASGRIIAKGLLILGKTKQELSYLADFRFGWYFSVILVALWFVMATILMEMGRSLRETTASGKE